MSGHGIRSNRLDARDSVRRKGEADGLGGGPGIDQVRRDDFLFVAIVTAEGLPYLVAVDAAWDNFAFPIEFDFVSAGQTWNLQGCFERDSFTFSFQSLINYNSEITCSLKILFKT